MRDFNAANYVGWEEVFVSSDKGKREVRYFLKRVDGEGDLVIVGKEKSPRHMSYRYAMKGLSDCYAKPKSRKDVVDWIHSIVSGNQPSGSLGQFVGDMGAMSDIYSTKDVQLTNPGRSKNDFMWLGSPLTSPKKRRHYKSFSRNGIIISSQDFVYVLAEEGKRLVAYLDDLYEDHRGNKMVAVRWFHKIDELGFTLPGNRSDREVFFSRCLQDLSIECIDGLATILSPEHYEKHICEATRKGLAPFMCFRIFDNDELKPFDITTVNGYWEQEILRNDRSSSDDGVMAKRSCSDLVGPRPTKRIRSESYLKPVDRNVTPSNNNKEGIGVRGSNENGTGVFLSVPECSTSPSPLQCLCIGSQVEVLSQDSGIRGCWFRGSISKRIKNKVKVRYQDLRDAIDDTKPLEEWVSIFRVASPDGLGIRIPGRTMVRPSPSSGEANVSCEITVGSIVDAWCYDGWWEGIVVKKESNNRLIVNFPGERQEMTFSPGNLRHSAEWVNNSWQIPKNRSEIAATLFGFDEEEIKGSKISEVEKKDPIAPKPHRNVIKIRISKDGESEMPQRISTVGEDLLAHWRWRYSGKKRSNRGPPIIIRKVLASPHCKENAGCAKFFMSLHPRNSTETTASTNLVMSQ